MAAGATEVGRLLSWHPFLERDPFLRWSPNVRKKLSGTGREVGIRVFVDDFLIGLAGLVQIPQVLLEDEADHELRLICVFAVRIVGEQLIVFRHSTAHITLLLRQHGNHLQRLRRALMMRKSAPKFLVEDNRFAECYRIPRRPLGGLRGGGKKVCRLFLTAADYGEG